MLKAANIKTALTVFLYIPWALLYTLCLMGLALGALLGLTLIPMWQWYWFRQDFVKVLLIHEYVSQLEIF